MNDRTRRPNLLHRAAGIGALFCSTVTVAQQGLPVTNVPAAPATDPIATFAWADFDQDGLLDAAAVQADGSLSLLMNLGDGSFADVTASAGVDAQNVSFVLFEDGNGDGQADLFVASKDRGGSQLLLNQAGIFQNATVGSGLESLAGVREAQWLDYDADGLLDLHVSSPGANTLFHALGVARFEPIDLPVAQPGQVSAFTTASLGLLTESAGEHGAASLGSTDVDVDNQTTIVAGGGSRTPLGGPTGPGGGTQNMSTVVPGWPQCTRLITDDATGTCMAASSTPTLGMLYPLSTDFFVDTDGDVGLGTTSPDRRLVVEDDASTGLARFRNTNSFGSAAVEFTDEVGNPRTEIGYSNFLDGAAWAGSSYLEATGSDLVLATGGTERMQIKEGGNIGIGTTDPDVDFALEIEDVGVGMSWSGGIAAGSSIDNKVVLGDLNGVATIGGHSADLDAWTDLSINPSGNVGIGTQGPSNKLSVSGTTDISGSLGIGTASPQANLHLRSTQSTVVRLEADTNNAGEGDQPRIELSQDGGLEGGIVGFRNSSNDLGIVATGATGDLVLGAADAEQMRIERNGIVRVGQAGQPRIEIIPTGGAFPRLTAKRPDGSDHAYLGDISGDYYNCVVSPSSFVQAGMYYDTSADDGVLFAAVKNFRETNPRNANTDIVYACVEGPEAAAYVRGTGQLVNGQATIQFPQHFSDIVTAAGLTIQLTPRSAGSLGLAVVDQSTKAFTVRELHQGNGSYAFAWEAKAVRKGYENYEVIRPKLRVPATKQGQFVSND